ncbi:MAG: DUF4349 domain-containing protein [Lachnospiraceae bacterium]|nr:DUF4349 domain-containing protein [Candidatus Equihabitans merdae]
MKKRIGLFALAALMAISLMGCGRSYAKSEASEAVMEEPYYGGNGLATYGEAAAEADYEEAYEEEAAEERVGGIDLTSQAQSEQKLVYTCSISMETLEYNKTLQAVNDLIAQYEGIIEYEGTSNSDYNWYRAGDHTGTWSTYLTIRIPAESYQAFLTDLEGTGGQIRDKSQNVQNITGAYNDQAVLVEALKTQEERLLKMMEEAETIEEMIAVEARLTEVQTELNQANSVLSGYDTDVSYSTVNLSIQEVKDYSVVEDEESFGQRLARTFKNSWSDFASFLQTLVVIILYLFPFLLILAAIVALVVFLAKKASKNRPPRAPKPKKEKKSFLKKNKKAQETAEAPQQDDGAK